MNKIEFSKLQTKEDMIIAFNQLKDDYKKLFEINENLQEIQKEHSIMKQFIYENGLWERFLNDDRFIEHLRSKNNE